MRTSTTVVATGAAFVAACVVFLATFGVGLAPTSAQDNSPAVKAVHVGEYLPLNFGRKLQLTASAALRPELYKRAEVAYSYDAVAIKENATLDVVEAMALGEVWIGTKARNTPLLVTMPTGEAQRTLDQIVSGKFSSEKFSTWLKAQHEQAVSMGKELVVVSTIDNLAGLTPTQEYLAWNPQETINLKSLDSELRQWE